MHMKCSGVKGRLNVDSNYQCMKYTVKIEQLLELQLEDGESIECV